MSQLGHPSGCGCRRCSFLKRGIPAFAAIAARSDSARGSLDGIFMPGGVRFSASLEVDRPLAPVELLDALHVERVGWLP